MSIEEFFNACFKADEYSMIRKLIAVGGTMRIFIDDKGILCVSTTKFWQVLPASTEFHRTVIKKMDEALLLETCTLMAALEKDAR